MINWSNPPRSLVYEIKDLGGSDRKFKLFACSTIRHMWKHLDERVKLYLDVAEREADGLASEKEVNILKEKASRAKWTDYNSSILENARRDAEWLFKRSSFDAACETTYGVNRVPDEIQIELLKDIFGNIEDAVELDFKGMPKFIKEFALDIYTKRDFQSLPILADALEENGCVCQKLLDHLRSGGYHVRGCWGLDVILEKK